MVCKINSIDKYQVVLGKLKVNKLLILFKKNKNSKECVKLTRKARFLRPHEFRGLARVKLNDKLAGSESP